MPISGSGDNDEHIVGGTDQTTIGNVADSLKVNVTNTATVSGTVTANQGSPTSLANKWPVTVTDGTNTMPTMDATARAGFEKITDGTNVAAVKAASTAAASSDPSLVVALSPNSALPTGSNVIGAVTQSGSWSTTVSGTVTANQGGTWTVQPGNTANTTPWLVTVNQGGNSAAVTAADALKVDGSAVTQPVSGTITANQGGTWNINNISGTVSLPTGASTSALQTTGNTSLASIVTNTNPLNYAQGSTTSGQSGNLIMGAVTTAAPSYTTGQTSPLSLTPSGALRVDTTSSQPNPTYGASITALVTANSPTDIFTITGSGTKTIYIWEIGISGNTGASAEDFVILKRSSANSGGTSTTPTAVPYDSSDAAATATVRAYTANPTSLGTLVGNIKVANIDVKQPQQQMWQVLFGASGFTKPLTVRGTSQVVAVNCNAATIAGAAVDLYVTWTEA